MTNEKPATLEFFTYKPASLKMLEIREKDGIKYIDAVIDGVELHWDSTYYNKAEIDFIAGQLKRGME